jgi:4-diphosphocytidyl-2-C-methyl-D-erythritol kinase
MLAPPVGDALVALEGQPGCLLARMSGSGGTCFGLFADEAIARAGAARIAAAEPAWWVVAAPVLA